MRAASITLAGDLIVATNTDEESSGAGGSALVARGLRADAGIVTEPTDFRTWVACRGSEYGVIRVPGRPGHAEVRHPDWRRGGAVNAIEKAGVVLEAIASLRARWAADDAFRHPVLSAPSLLPTVVSGGEWPVTYPSSCDLTIAVMYLPVQADGEGWGSTVREEVAGVDHAASAHATTGWPSTRRRSSGGATASCRWRSPSPQPIVGAMLGAERRPGAATRARRPGLLV